ncbi:hypothetical protein [Amycolatopsis saalfeldensis]|uniref:Uncharacterized protein n=1 Tax=Amycolatopsis saalfeldensis TaxID=394193 RepID=A0A1H8YPK1_9PSEU|nr:hypothetical protein [Amycolatopsis saalfeldensis]SEP54145.1 hypothetical protein SAMN04489732_13746 [Amycolatopsis saalfeldensis]
MVGGLAELPWDREVLRDGQNGAGEQTRVHQFFEGTLAITVYDVKTGMWRAGATRSNCEPTIDKVLRQLARDPTLRAIGERSAQIAIGLISGKGRTGATPEGSGLTDRAGSVSQGARAVGPSTGALSVR